VEEPCCAVVSAAGVDTHWCEVRTRPPAQMLPATSERPTVTTPNATRTAR
jgi:hypothetical protein